MTKIRLTQRELQNGNRTLSSIASTKSEDHNIDSDDDDDDYVSLQDIDPNDLDLELGSLTQIRSRSRPISQGRMLRSLCCISYPTAKPFHEHF